MPIPLVTRILVADDNPIVRSGLRKVLDAQADLAVVAEASRVDIALDAGTDSVVLCVADDGRGLRETGSVGNGHAGLRGMRERALLVGGALAGKDGRDGGVEVRCEVPAESA